jgi:hypothetical protein
LDNEKSLRGERSKDKRLDLRINNAIFIAEEKGNVYAK